MINKVLQTIKKYGLINSKDKIVIGVSGGPDSMCLLHILNEIKNSMNLQIVVAHMNHLIRPEAEDETKYVQEFCAKRNIECYVKRVDIPVMAREEKNGTEEAGRKARYDFFDEVLKEVSANKIAIAHNANDNAETVLMNIIRGTGTTGLKGIDPIRDNKYIRPLIECERYEIEGYCKENNIDAKIDKSNFENIYTRNKIRNIIIPEIKKEFNPNIIESLNKLSALARQENEYIQKYTEELINNELIENEEMINDTNGFVINLKKFNKLDSFIKNKVILSSINRVLGCTSGIEKIHIEDIVKLCANNIGNKYLTPNKKIKVMLKKGKIYFIKMI